MVSNDQELAQLEPILPLKTKLKVTTNGQITIKQLQYPRCSELRDVVTRTVASRQSTVVDETVSNKKVSVVIR